MIITELNTTLSDYQLKWKTLAAGRRDRAFFDNARPTSVGWKVADLGEFDKDFAVLRAFSDQIHLGWINERWVASFHLREKQLPWGIELVKLMQLRPGSSDRTGLDHVDFLTLDGLSAAILETSEPDLNITDEQNGHCKWVSVWFGETEAKLRNETTLDVCIAELQDVNEQVKSADANTPAH
jgi:hypothetical protein